VKLRVTVLSVQRKLFPRLHGYILDASRANPASFQQLSGNAMRELGLNSDGGYRIAGSCQRDVNLRAYVIGQRVILQPYLDRHRVREAREELRRDARVPIGPTVCLFGMVKPIDQERVRMLYHAGDMIAPQHEQGQVDP
jgi:hypothetical protein